MRALNPGALTLLALLTLSACGTDSGDRRATADGSAELPRCDPDNGGISLPPGFCAVLVHEGVGEARHITVAPNGDVYVALRRAPQGSDTEGIVAIRDTTGDGRADVVEQFGEFRGTGIAVVDGHLYFATDTSVVRYALPSDGSLRPTGPAELMVHGFPSQRSHAAKPLAFDGSGSMWVFVGAPSNNCGGETDRQPGARGLDPCPELEWTGGAWRFDANRPNQHQRDGEHWATGIRNAVAIAFNPDDGNLWAVQHGRDQLNVADAENFSPEDNAVRPAEELHRLARGSTFSWPFCFFDLQTDRFVLNPEYGGTGTETGQCDRFPQPVAVYGGHWAPNDMLFYRGTQFPRRYRDGAFIAFHGSWNRAPLPQEGYNVVFQPLTSGAGGGSYEVFADGFAGRSDLPSPGEAEARPMGLAEGPDGSLYISDSVQGKVWRVMYVGER